MDCNGYIIIQFVKIRKKKLQSEVRFPTRELDFTVNRRTVFLVLVGCTRWTADHPQCDLQHFSQRRSGHQTLSSQIFSRADIPIQKLDFSQNSLRRIANRLFSSVADTLEELNLSYNLLGDNLNPIFATSEFHGLTNLKVLDLTGNQIRGLEEGILRGCLNLQVRQIYGVKKWKP